MSDTMLLVQFRLAGEAPDLGDAARRLGVDVVDLDMAYGLVSVDPADRLYVVRVGADQEATVRKALKSGDPAEGIFGDPRIEPMGDSSAR